MKRSRKPRRTINEPWLICTEHGEWSLYGQLINLSETGALFSVPDELDIRERIFACPHIVASSVSPNKSPTPQDIRNHPNCVSGIVVRRDGADRYGVKFDRAESMKPAARTVSGFSAEIRETGLLLIVKAKGAPTLDRAVSVQGKVRSMAKSYLRLLFDFSEVVNPAQTVVAIYCDMIERFSKSNRWVGAINFHSFAPRFVDTTASEAYIHHFKTRNDADEYIRNNPIRCLVIEDDPVSSELIRSFLDRSGIEPLMTSSAEEGIALARRQPPNAALVDIHLPGMNGLEAVRAIREDASMQKLPVIILTGDAAVEQVKIAREVKVVGYLLKPLDANRFRSLFVSALAKEM